MASNPNHFGPLPNASLMLLRVVTGAFLMQGTLDNMLSSERMQEFVVLLAQNGLPVPHLMAPSSVYAQFICGALLVLGLLTRWADPVIAINFVVAVVTMHWPQDFRGWWPARLLMLLGLHFMAQCGGRFALDALRSSSQPFNRA